MLARRLLHRQILQVVRHDQAGHVVLGKRDAHALVDQLAHLRRYCRGLHVMAGDVLEQRPQIDFLLIVRAHADARRLADDGEHRLMVLVRVVQTVEQMNGAWTGSGKADTQLAARVLGMGSSHECRLLLMPDLHEFDLAGLAADRAHDPVDAVAGITVDTADAPFIQAIQHELADGLRHGSPLFRSPAASRLRSG